MSPDNSEKLVNQVMPDSAYNTERLGAGLIWDLTVDFHKKLKQKAIQLTLEAHIEPESVSDAINLVKQSDVLKALNEINREVSTKIDIPNIDKEASREILRAVQNFQEELRHKSKDIAKRKGEDIQVQHVRQALEKRDEKIKELALAFGSGLVGVFLGELIQTIPKGELPSSLHGIALAIGIFLVFWKRNN